MGGDDDNDNGDDDDVDDEDEDVSKKFLVTLAGLKRIVKLLRLASRDKHVK